MKKKTNNIMKFSFFGVLLVAAILTLGTFWTNISAKRDTEQAVRSVSLLYLDELTERREQVLHSRLDRYITIIQKSIGMIRDDDMDNTTNLQAYQTRIKQIYSLEEFAFVDANGLILTSSGASTEIDRYNFNYNNLTDMEISIKEQDDGNKKVVIAIPATNLEFNGVTITSCFIEVDISVMLNGVLLEPGNNNTTFSNIYTKDGVALTDMPFGSLSADDNLLEELETAEYAEPNSFAGVKSDFENHEEGVVSCIYGGYRKTLSYVPIRGTDWMLVYLIREDAINDQINSISFGIITRSLIQSILIAIILIGLFMVLIRQTNRAAQLALEKETSEAENRVKQQELEQRLALQEQLIEQKKQRTEQDNMITALASDYRSVYYVNLDRDECTCYRSEIPPEEGPQIGDQFRYHDLFTRYANDRVAEKYREGFMDFIDPDNIRKRLETEALISYSYLTIHHGIEAYEMLRIANVRRFEDREDDTVHAIGIGFTNIDTEMRESMAKNQMLSDALNAAEEASKAKTAFLSNMSHEIRTPMNAIIGLDTIALSDPGISEQTREYLVKINNSAQHLLGLINDILDMSRIESGRMALRDEEFSFSKLLEQINTIFSGQCTEKGLHYNCKINGEVENYYIGDDVKLRQVLINILGNAVKFTSEGGKVELTVAQMAQFNGQATLRFDITDTGVGISEEFLPHLFDAFAQEDSSATNKYGSTGLGMAITKSIVEMMNGTIEVHSKKGKGTTFTVTVTLMKAEHRNVDNNNIEIHPHEMSVLVVDDDPVACEHAKLVLAKVGIACDTELSGEKAIEMVKLHHARQEPYNLILVDLKMPDMDGIETTRQIRELVGNESAIIIITAYKWDDVQTEAIEAGVDSFIAKPVFAPNVLDEFTKALKRKRFAEQKAQPKAELKGRHVLLAEDVQVNADIMKMVLKMRELEIDHAENGKIAVEMFEKSEEGYYDVILMDIRMPEMNGLDAASAIRAMERSDSKTIPIIALTANAFDEDVQRSLQAGMNAHLTKPIEAPILFETLENLIK